MVRAIIVNLANQFHLVHRVVVSRQLKPKSNSSFQIWTQIKTLSTISVWFVELFSKNISIQFNSVFVVELINVVFIRFSPGGRIFIGERNHPVQKCKLKFSFIIFNNFDIVSKNNQCCLSYRVDPCKVDRAFEQIATYRWVSVQRTKTVAWAIWQWKDVTTIQWHAYHLANVGTSHHRSVLDVMRNKAMAKCFVAQLHRYKKCFFLHFQEKIDFFFQILNSNV